jgi:Fe-S oxidoreductase
MLTLPEKIIFSLAVISSLYAAMHISSRIIRTIARGKGNVDWGIARKRLGKVFVKIITFQPVFRFRFVPSFFHALVAWGFIYFLFVNLFDIMDGYLSGFRIPGLPGNIYRLGSDILSVLILGGMIALIIRRWLIKPDSLTTRKDILLNPEARKGIRRDSAVVGGFILVHVGSRFLGQSFQIARGFIDPWQPFASFISRGWGHLSPTVLEVYIHVFFWVALGSILAFIPYFLYSKHLHLFFAPINFLLKPERRSIGELDKIAFDDESNDQFGASHLEDLGWEQIMDAYACIMCFRCQEVCPAYNTGKTLSPAAMEINKRYYLNHEGTHFGEVDSDNKQPDTPLLTDFAIPTDAIWACTACGACVDICPVGNEPMRDILQIRRALVLTENNFPGQLQTAFRGMERTGNPWSISSSERLTWAEGLNVTTIKQNPKPDILWWVGCAPATDARAQKIARAFTCILQAAKVNYAVLGEQEQCTGDSARRAGNEYLFNELALANTELLNRVAPKRIVTTCPHCLHTIKNEYPAFGGNYAILHHTQFIEELLSTGLLKLNRSPDSIVVHQKITFHDPCYLGRQNNVLNEPRHILHRMSEQYVELPRHGKKSFCCGAGGAQMWKEEQHGVERVNANRFREVQRSGAKTLAVGCPFCMIMLTDAKNDAHDDMQVLDIAEIVESLLDK